MKNEARLFWVVEGTSYDDTENQNEEIFATQEQANEYAKVFGTDRPYRIYIGEVRNYYWEKDSKGWNYDDQADTFKHIITVTTQTDTTKAHN